MTVVVRFVPPTVRYVRESKRLPPCELTDQKDGSLLARFQLTSTVEVKSWALGFEQAP